VLQDVHEADHVDGAVGEGKDVDVGLEPVETVAAVGLADQDVVAFDDQEVIGIPAEH